MNLKKIEKIVKEFNQEYDKGILGKDNRGRKKQEVEDIEILKKSYYT